MPETTEAEEENLEPKSEAAEVGPCKVKLTIEITADKVKEKIENKYQELNDTMALPGFRKGHAPRPLLERKFGKQILEETKYELLSKSFDEVKEARELEPLGEPDIDPEKLEVKENEAFKYEVTVEVRPQIALKAYTGVAVKRVPTTVDEKDVEVELRAMQEGRAEYVPAEDGVSKADDQVVADFDLKVGDKSIDKSENNAIVLDSDISFYGVALPEFHKALSGHKVGDTVEVDIKMPENWPDKTHAGKDAKIVTTIKSIKRRRLPAIDAAFAKAFDMDSIDELKEHVRKDLGREKEKEAQHAMADKVVESILKENDFPLPEGLIKASTEEAALRARTRLLMEGKSEAEAAAEADKQAAQSKEEVVQAIRERFVLEHIAQKEKIFVTEDQVEERVQQLAQRVGKWPHEMRTYLEEQGLLTQLRRNMREEAVREFLLSKAKVEE